MTVVGQPQMTGWANVRIMRLFDVCTLTKLGFSRRIN